MQDFKLKNVRGWELRDMTIGVLGTGEGISPCIFTLRTEHMFAMMYIY